MCHMYILVSKCTSTLIIWTTEGMFPTSIFIIYMCLSQQISWDHEQNLFTCVPSFSFGTGGVWLLVADSWNRLHIQKSTKPREVNLHIAWALIFICRIVDLYNSFYHTNINCHRRPNRASIMFLTKGLSRRFIWSLSCRTTQRPDI